MVPLSVTSMEIAMPADTMLAPMCPMTRATASEAGRGEAAIALAGSTYCTPAFTSTYRSTDCSHAGNQRNRNIALRLLYLAGDHVQVVPAVIGPQRRHQRRHEAGDAAFGAGEGGGKVAPAASGCAAGAAEADHHDAKNDCHLQHREHELEFAGLLDSKVVQKRNENGSGNGHKLSPGDGERDRDNVRGEERKDRERAENANQSGRDRGYRCRLGDDEPRPGIEKASQGSVSVADINIFAAGLRLHGAQFGVGERAKKRQQPAHQPRQIHQLGGTYRLHHLGGNEKNSAADDCAHDHRGGVADA